jgi:hypothetical protein
MEVNVPEIKCELCGFMMKQRINGSHLMRKHSISIETYTELFPEALTGKYITGEFICQICNVTVSNFSSVKRKHILSHGLTVDEYNQKYLAKKCHCGCGINTEYSYHRKCYNDYLEGHYSSWNKGLSKADGHNLNGGGWNIGLTKGTDNRILSQSINIKVAWESGSYNSMITEHKKTMLSKYGVTNYSYTKEFKQQCISSSLERYGVEHPMQYPEIYSRSKKGRYKFKHYTWPSGNVSEVQGYEPYALDILLETFTESDIVVEKTAMPEIWYYLSDGIKRHRYFPDIWIPSNNKFIEVKSVYTWNLDKESLYYKSKGIKDLGFLFEIWIIENKKIKTII